MEEETGLADCPFCQGPANMEKRPGCQQWRAGCPECGVYTGWHYRKESAAGKWNRRGAVDWAAHFRRRFERRL